MSILNECHFHMVSPLAEQHLSDPLRIFSKHSSLEICEWNTLYHNRATRKQPKHQILATYTPNGHISTAWKPNSVRNLMFLSCRPNLAGFSPQMFARTEKQAYCTETMQCNKWCRESARQTVRHTLRLHLATSSKIFLEV